MTLFLVLTEQKLTEQKLTEQNLAQLFQYIATIFQSASGSQMRFLNILFTHVHSTIGSFICTKDKG